jgi:hypothetical protein
MRQTANLLFLSVIVIMAAVIAGCSTDTPMSPATDTASLYLSPGTPVQIKARVATTDQNRLMLTLEGCPDTVIAYHNCQIVRLENDNESPVPFVDIHPGDSVDVNGVRQQNGYVYAHKICICQSTGGQYDLAFRDTIVTIDYTYGTFTVAGRSEVITVDENTLIWGNIITKNYGDPNMFQNRNQVSSGSCAAKPNPDYFTTTRDTILVFTDLAVGDVVEVRASIIDEATLLAVKIKLANCTEKLCVEFNAVLASVDVDTRVVTFDGLDWVGNVCSGARLIGLDGEPLTLADFAVGELVAVKGVPFEDGTLRICQMVKLPTT